MRNPFHRRSTLERILEPVATQAPRVVKSGLAAAGTFIGVSLASAAMSKARERQQAG
jgi:hypothetical protein